MQNAADSKNSPAFYLIVLLHKLLNEGVEGRRLQQHFVQVTQPLACCNLENNGAMFLSGPSAKKYSMEVVLGDAKLMMSPSLSMMMRSYVKE